MLRDLLIKNRSYRRFDSSVKISQENVERWIELSRLSASGMNRQPLKYMICTNEELNDKIFPHLGWAGYLTEWKGPKKGEQPVAYIAVLLDKNVSKKYYCDDGIAMQNILLGAVEDGFGGCIIGSVNKGKVGKLFELPENLEILWMIALGKPAEKVVIDDVNENNIKYWRDSESVHHVPKRSLKEIIYKSI